MNRNFEDTVVFTTQNPETFLSFHNDTSIVYTIDPSISAEYSNLYINGWSASKMNSGSDYSLTLNRDASLAVFHLYTDSKCIHSEVQYLRL